MPTINTKDKLSFDIKNDFDQTELIFIGDAEIDDKGLVNHHISSSNDLYKIGIPSIITQGFKVEKEIINKRDITPEDRNITKINVTVTFTDVFMSKPTTTDYYTGKEEVAFPNTVLLSEKTYSGNLKVNATIKAVAHMKDGTTKEKTDSISNFKICRIPVVVKSNLCNLHGLSKEALMQLNENPLDTGGYYIIKGVEWVIDCIENILFNQIRIFKNEGYSKEVIRVEYVSKPGDAYQNSEYLLIRLLNDNQLCIEILRNQLKGLQIPFYLIFRLLGWTTDKEIYDNIIFDYNSNISKNIINFLNSSLDAKYAIKGIHLYDKTEILNEIINELKYTDFKYLNLDTNPENYKIAYQKIYNTLDVNFLPHIGNKPEDRINKLRYLALIIRKIFLVKLNIIEPTDRDSYKCKRIYASGTSYAKAFKTYFNASAIQALKRRITKDFGSNSFEQIDLVSTVKSSIYGSEFERSMIQTITSGNKSQITIQKKTKTNRLSSQLLDRSNQIATISTLRQITTPNNDSSKQSGRANEMRRVHMSFLGYICCIHSSDGEKVGINKQLAIFSNILCASSSVILKDLLLLDKLIIPLNDANYSKVVELSLKNIFVNGEWIGFTKDTIAIVKKYRKMRRDLKIHPNTTIYWDNLENEVYFWVDVGRISRPLLTVYNNISSPEMFPGIKYKKDNFKQGIKINKSIIDRLKTKEIGVEFLLENKIIEYITAEEQENCFICPFYNQLDDDKTNELKQYTHCDIPQSILGITALTGPFANHNQSPRITFQGNQCRQTCGIFSLNWPFRCDKDTFLQYLCETPLVKTIATKYIMPNGSNTIVAIACYSGYNQEDSIVVSKGAVERGLFNGCKFTFIKSELEQREEFGNPDVSNTLDIKNGSYSKINNGIIKKGTKIEKNDVIIGKISKLPKTQDSTFKYIDKSITYKSSENAIVHNVINDRNDDDEKFVKVCIRKNRPVAIGDKFSVKGNSEVLTDIGWLKIKDIDINTHKVATLSKDNELAYVNPTGLSKYHYDGEMYNLQTDQLKICTTKNHKLYVKKTDMLIPSDNYFELLRTYDVIGKKVRFKKNAINKYLHQEFYEINGKKYNMSSWIKLIGLFISSGYLENQNTSNAEIYITTKNIHKKNIYLNFLNNLNITFNLWEENIYISHEKYPEIFNELIKLLDINHNKILPKYVWCLSQVQSRLLLLTLSNTSCYKSYYNKKIGYFTSNKLLADDITKLGLHSGWSGIVTKIDNNYNVNINRHKNEPLINHMHFPYQNNQIEKYEHYNGMVYCLEIPDSHLHVYYSRDDSYSPPIWTGNSSRHGQKGVAGILLRDSDMPFTEDGMRPSIIINPHAIPSRMTIGQLYEMQAGNYCAKKGTHIDATIFKKIDIDELSNELESIGMNKYGYHRLYSGITGEFIDCMIFMGPTYYQRLQKFVIDTIYSVGKGPSDVLSRQPLDGMASSGGLKIGEMERDVLCSHGASKVIHEKYFEHSDIFNEYICRCGKAAIVNTNNNIYKCKYCKDNADIAEVQTSWSSKLFMQELDSMNIGVRRQLEPFTYENTTNENKL